jgi:3-methyladenine DNA glycosylase AlkC
MKVIPPEILRRRGARSTAAVPCEVRVLLNEGRIEAVNLSEWLVIDHGELAGHVLPSVGRRDLVQPVRAALAEPGVTTAPKRLVAVAGVLAAGCAGVEEADALWAGLMGQPSDTARSWAAGLVGKHPLFRLADRLERLRGAAADRNMGVRESAWMAVRAEVADDPERAVRLLVPWTAAAEEGVRRFASEVTRPCGVWCAHITRLRENPGIGLPLLEPLRADPSRYVQNSVGNWLNDAARSRPGWVRGICAAWQEKGPSAATAWIVKRALRNCGP